MKQNLKLLLTATSASFLTFAAMAQVNTTPQPDRSIYTSQRMPHAQRMDRLNGAVKASDLIGMTVNNYQNEKLGKVDDIGIDVESGRIVQVILSTGGFLGIGDTLTAVPPGALHHDVAHKVLHLESDKEKLRAAPRFENSNWAACCDTNHLSTVYKYYGEESSYNFIQSSDSSPDDLRNRNGGIDNNSQRNTDGQRNNDGRLNSAGQRINDGQLNSAGQRINDGQLNSAGQRINDGQLNSAGQRNTDGQRNTAGQRDSDGKLNAAGQRNNDGKRTSDGQRNNDGSLHGVSTWQADETWNQNSGLRDQQSRIPVSRLSQIQRASRLMGTSVKNHQDELLGKVENLLVDLSSGRILAVIVSSGGFLSLGGELSAVPPTALRFNNERDTLQLDVSKETLSAAPHFQGNQWPDFNQPVYADGIYRAYKVEPYFRTNIVADADNTSRNVRDRDDRTLTPLDQGNSQVDTDTTAQIRKGILAAKGMSVNAQNVKIITNNGRVTLRGPVKSIEEKRMIGEIANRIARSENVDNQLEVSRNTTSN